MLTRGQQQTGGYIQFFRRFAVDRNGLIIVHKDFINSPPKSQMHITQKEKAIADDMVHLQGLVADSCVSYEDITNQLMSALSLHVTMAVTGSFSGGNAVGYILPVWCMTCG